MSKNEQDEVEKSMQDFLNRPIYKVLTAEILNNVSDESVEQTVIDNIQLRFNDDYSNEQEVVRSLTQGQIALYVTWILEAEVNNGGFNQFYYNSSGDFADLSVTAFRTFGATKFAALVGEADSIFNKIKDDLAKYDDGTVESFSESYENNPLNDLDDKFYELYSIENLSKLRIKYIREHTNEFIEQLPG